jgi:hypothetical protein
MSNRTRGPFDSPGPYPPSPEYDYSDSPVRSRPSSLGIDPKAREKAERSAARQLQKQEISRRRAEAEKHEVSISCFRNCNSSLLCSRSGCDSLYRNLGNGNNSKVDLWNNELSLVSLIASQVEFHAKHDEGSKACSSGNPNVLATHCVASLGRKRP